MINNEKLEQAFKMFDKDGSGSISGEEIAAVLGADAGLDPKILTDIIKECDENGDGEI